MAQQTEIVNARVQLVAQVDVSQTAITKQLPGVLSTIEKYINDGLKDAKVQISNIEFDFSKVAQGLASSGLVAALKTELANAGIKTVMSEVNDVAKQAAQTGKTEPVKDSEKQNQTKKQDSQIYSSSQKEEVNNLIAQLTQLRSLVQQVQQAQSALNSQPFDASLKRNLAENIDSLRAFMKEYKDIPETAQKLLKNASGTLEPEEQKELLKAQTTLNNAQARLSKAEIAGSDQVVNLNKQVEALKRINDETRQLQQLRNALNTTAKEDPLYKQYEKQIKALEKQHGNSESEYAAIKQEYDSKALDKTTYANTREVRDLLNTVNKLDLTRSLDSSQWTEMAGKVSQYKSNIDKLTQGWKEYSKVLKDAQKLEKQGNYTAFANAKKEADDKKAELTTKTETLNRGMRRLKEQYGYVPDELASGQSELSRIRSDAEYLNKQVAAESNPYMRNIQGQITLNKELTKLYQQQADLKKEISSPTSNRSEKELRASLDDVNKLISQRESALTNAAKRLKTLEEPTTDTDKTKALKDDLRNAEITRKIAYNDHGDQATDLKALEDAFKSEIKARQDYNKQRDALSKKNLSTAEYDKEIAKLNELKKARDSATQELLNRVSTMQGNLKKGDTLPTTLTEQVDKLTTLQNASATSEANTSPLARNLDLQYQAYGQLIRAQRDYINGQKQLQQLQPGDKNAQALQAKVKQAQDDIKAYNNQIATLKAESSQFANQNLTQAIRDKQTAIDTRSTEALLNDTKIQNVNADFGELKRKGTEIKSMIDSLKTNATNLSKMDVKDAGFQTAYNNLIQEKDAIEQNLQAYKQLANSRSGALTNDQKSKLGGTVANLQRQFDKVQTESINPITSGVDSRLLNVQDQLSRIANLKTAADELSKVYAKLGTNNLMDNDRSVFEQRAQALEASIAREKAALESLQVMERGWSSRTGNQLLTDALAKRDKEAANLQPKLDAISPSNQMIAEGNKLYADASAAASKYVTALNQLSHAGKGADLTALNANVTATKTAFDNAATAVLNFESKLATAGLTTPAFDSKKLALALKQSEIDTARLNVAKNGPDGEYAIQSQISSLNNLLYTQRALGESWDTAAKGGASFADLNKLANDWLTVRGAIDSAVDSLNNYASQQGSLLDIQTNPTLWSNYQQALSRYSDNKVKFQNLSDMLQTRWDPEIGTQMKAIAELQKVAQAYNSAVKSTDPQLRGQAGALKSQLDTLVSGLPSTLKIGSLSELADRYDMVAEAAKNAFRIIGTADKSAMAQETAASRMAKQLDNLYTSTTKYAEANSAIKGTMPGLRLEQLQAQMKESMINGNITPDVMAGYQRELASIKMAANEAGVATQTIGDKVLGAAQKFASWFGISQFIMSLVSQFRNLVEQVKAVDASMVELKKVTDLSKQGYSDYLKEASQMSQDIGVQLTDVIDSTAEFARLGNSVDMSQQLAKSALVFKTVGDGIESAADASEKIISISAAYGIAAKDSMSIVDKLNEVGNNYAISSGSISEVLTRAGASLAQAGSNLDESIGLALGGNMVVRNAATTGTALKTLALRLTKTKTELAEMGEETDGAAETISEYRDKLLALTHQKVDILNGDEYKSTTQILREMSGVWKEMNSMEQSAALEIMGGVRQSNVVMSIIQNWEQVESAIESAKNSEGSAMAENERALDSITGKLQQFTAAQQTFATSFFEANAFKSIVDTGTAAIGVVTKLTDQFGSLAVAAGVINGLFSMGNKGLVRGDLGLIGQKIQPAYVKEADRSEKTKRNALLNSSLHIGNLPTYEQYRTTKVYADILRRNEGSLVDVVRNGQTEKKAVLSKGFAFTADDIQAINSHNNALDQYDAVVKRFGSSSAEANSALQKLQDTFKALPPEAQVVAKEMGKIPVVMNSLADVSVGQSSFKTKILGNLKSLAGGALGMGLGALIGAGIQKAIEGIEYLVNWDSHKIEEAQQVIDQYEAVASSVKENTTTLEGIKPEFDTLSAGVDSIGNNISLSADQYARYQEIVAQVVGISPSLIAAYDSEGNALANKNSLIEKAIELEQQRLAVAQQERREEASKTFEGAKSTVREAHNKTLDAYNALKDVDKNFMESTRQKLGLDKKTMLDEASGKMVSVVNSPQYYSADDFMKIINEYDKEISRLNSLPEPDLSKISELQVAKQNLVVAQAELRQAERAYVEEGLLFASSIEGYDKLSSKAQAAISTMINNVTVADVTRMGGPDEYFDFISKMVYTLGEKRTQYALDAAELLNNRFNADLSQLNAEGLDTIGLGEYRSSVEDVIKALRQLGVEQPELLFTEQIEQANQLEAAIEEIHRGYSQGLQLMSKLGSVQAMRGFVEGYNLFNAGFQANGSAMSERATSQLADIYGSNNLDNVQRVKQLAELFSSGYYSTDMMQSMLEGFKQMDSISFDNFIRQGKMANDIINAFGWTIKDNADEIRQFRDALSDMGLDNALGQLDHDFEFGKLDSQQYDASLKAILTSWNETANALDSAQLDKAIENLSKSINPEILKERLTSASTALQDFLSMDLSTRAFGTSALDDQIDSLEKLAESAMEAHDVSSYTKVTQQLEMLRAAADHATDPVSRLAELTELYGTALSEQASAGTLSIETYRQLATAGKEYADILTVTADGIRVNEQALSQLIQAESKEQQAQIASQRSEQIQYYAELADQYERLSAVDRDSEIGRALLDEMNQVQELITGYSALITTIDEAAGARARLSAVTSAPTPIDETEVFTSAYTQAGEYIEAGRLGDAAKILRELSGQAIKTEEDLRGVYKQLDFFGEDAEGTLNGLFKRLTSLDAKGAFDGIMSSFSSDGWELMPEDIPVIAKIVGIDEGVLQGIVNGAESYDLEFSATLNPSDYITNIEKMQSASNDAYRAIERDGDSVKINVEELTKMLGTRYSSDFIYSLLNDIYMLKDELNATLVDMNGNELNLLGALDASGLDQLQNFMSSLESFSPRIKNALDNMGGSVEPIDLSEWKATLVALGAGQQEYELLKAYFEANDIKVIVDGEVKGASEIPEQLDEIAESYEQFVGIMGDSVEIGFDLHVEGAGEALAQADVATEAIEKLRGWAVDNGDEEIRKTCEVALEIRSHVEESNDAKDAIGSVYSVAQEVINVTMPSGKLDPITDSANAAQGALQVAYDTLVKFQNFNATANVTVNVNQAQLDSAITKLKQLNTNMSTASIGGSTSGKGNSKATLNHDNASARFATGTKYAKPGLALVNDGTPVNGSAAELIIRRNTNEAYIANGGEIGFTQLERGDKVYTAAETQKILRGKADVRYKRFAKGGPTQFGSGGSSGSGSGNKGTSGSGSGSTSSGSNATKSNSNNNSNTNSSKQETKQTKSDYERLYAELKHMREMDLKDTKSYLDELNDLYQQHLDMSEDKIDDYYKAQEEVYKGYISWVNDEYQRSLTKLQNQRDMDLIDHGQYIRALEALNAEYYENAQKYYNGANPELEEKKAANDVSVYKEKKTLHQENYDKAIAELDAKLAYGEIRDLEYYKAIAVLNELFWANNKAYEEEYKKYTLQSFKDIKDAQEKLIDECIDTLDFKLAVHIIEDDEYQRLKREQLQKKIDLLVSVNAPDSEIQKVIQEMYEMNQDYIVKSADKEFAEVERWRDQSLISASEAADRMEEINERMFGAMKHQSEEYLEHEKEIYELRLDAAKESYDKEMSYMSNLRDFGIMTDLEYYKREAQMIQEQFLKDPSNVKLYQQGLDLALPNLANIRNAQIEQMQTAKDYFTTRINYEIDELEDRKKDHLEPFERQRKLLERQKREVERERTLVARQQRGLQQQESALNREKRALQRIIDANNHSEELELRPLQDEQYELQRREREITRQYSKLIKPYQDAQKVKQREQSRLQHEQELALRPLQKTVDQLNRAQSLLSKQYDDRMYPIQEQIKALEKEKKLAQDNLNIDKARMALDKARTEKTFLVYREGLGYVYDTDREAIEEAEKNLRELDIEDQIEKLQSIVDALEDERDKLLRPMSDQAFWLNEGIQDIQDYYTALLEPISDTLYDLGEIMQDMSDAQDSMLAPIQERLEDISDLIDGIQRKYELANRPLNDQMYLLNQQADVLEDQLDAINIALEGYDAQLDEINDQIEDIDYEMDKISDEYDDQLDVLEKHLRKWELLADEAELLRKRQEAIKVLGKEVYEWEEKFADKAFDVNEAWEDIDNKIKETWADINRIVTEPTGMYGLIKLAEELGYDFEVIGYHIKDFDANCAHSVTSMSALVAEANKVIQGTVKLSQLVQDAKSYVDHQNTHLQYGANESSYYTNPSTGQQIVNNTATGTTSNYSNTVAPVNTKVDEVKQLSLNAQNPNSQAEAQLKSIIAQAGQYKTQMQNLLAAQKKGGASTSEVVSMTKTIGSFLSGSKATVMAHPGVTGYTTAMVNLEQLAATIGTSISKYSTGRRTGGAELAITQEKGPEAIAAQKNGKFTFLAPGDMVFSKAQTENLWKMSIHPETPTGRGNGTIPKVETHQSQENKYTISIGDVNIQSANDPQELSRAIIEKLPNQILQDIRRR